MARPAGLQNTSLYFALRAALRAFKIARQLLLHCSTTMHPCINPDDFVELQVRFLINQTILITPVASWGN